MFAETHYLKIGGSAAFVHFFHRALPVRVGGVVVQIYAYQVILQISLKEYSQVVQLSTVSV